MSLSAPFNSSWFVVRAFAWFVLFLLLMVVWVFIVTRFPLAGFFQFFSKFGLSEIQSIMTLSLLPPMLPTMLIWLKWRKPGSAATTAEAGVTTNPETIATPVNTLHIVAWSAITPFGDAAATLAGTQEKQAVFYPDKAIAVANAEDLPFFTARIEALPLTMFACPAEDVLAYPVETRSRSKRTTAMLLIVLNALHEKKEMLDIELPVEQAVRVFWLPPTESMLADAPSPDDVVDAFATAWQRSAWNTTKHTLASFASKKCYEILHNLQHSSHQAHSPITLIIAADSLLDPEELAQPIAQGMLYSGATKNGFIPAEGAGGLLLVDASYAIKMDLSNLNTLGPVNSVQRESERNANAEIDSAPLTRCINLAMRTSQTSADKIGAILCDTDHRLEPRGLEVIAAMLQTLPEHKSLNRISPMEYAGSVGLASDIIHLALAAEIAEATEQAILNISVADAKQTAAVMILPQMKEQATDIF